jgi:hypothetical protein
MPMSKMYIATSTDVHMVDLDDKEASMIMQM